MDEFERDFIVQIRIPASMSAEFCRRLTVQGEAVVLGFLAESGDEHLGTRPSENQMGPGQRRLSSILWAAGIEPVPLAVQGVERGVLAVGSLRLDLYRSRAWVGNDELGVTARELALLAYMANPADRTVSKVDLLRDVWGRGAEGSPNAVEVCIAKLRRKLEVFDGVEIATVRGKGYRLRA